MKEEPDRVVKSDNLSTRELAFSQQCLLLNSAMSLTQMLLPRCCQNKVVESTSKCVIPSEWR